MFVGLYIAVFRATAETKEELDAEIVFSHAGNNRNMIPALSLKLQMMRHFSYLMSGYFIYELLWNGLLPILGDRSTEMPLPIDPYTPLREQCCELLFICGLLYLIRPRVWPPQFEIGFIDDFDELLENFL